MKTVAYLRVSKDSQDVANQRLIILDYTHKSKFSIDHFIEISVSSRKTTKERRIDELLHELNPKDRLVVSELSRLGRSVGQIIQIVDHLIKSNVAFIAIKENIVLNGKQNMQTKVMVTMFGLFAEIERDLISQRTKAGACGSKSKRASVGATERYI